MTRAQFIDWATEYRIEPNLFHKGHVEWNLILTAKLAKLKLTEWGNIRGYPW